MSCTAFFSKAPKACNTLFIICSTQAQNVLFANFFTRSTLWLSEISAHEFPGVQALNTEAMITSQAISCIPYKVRLWHTVASASSKQVQFSK